MNNKWNGRRELKPRLRFPEFIEPWEYKGLGPFLRESSERTPANTELPIYSSTRSGLKPQKDYYDGRELINDGDYGVVPEGFFVYRHMSDDGTFKFNINKTGKKIAVSKEYPVFTTVDLCSDFLLHILNDGPEFAQFALEQKKGGTRTRLYFNSLGSWETLLPSHLEQQKIADCLSSIEELITAEGRVLDALKAHKKGLMQQLFPAEGETVPRLRFPEFLNAPPWREARLSNYIDLVSGLHLSPTEYGESGDVPYFTGPSEFTNSRSLIAKWTNKSANTAIERDILITVKGSGVGELWNLTLPCVAMGRQLMAIRAKQCSSEFLYQSLTTRYARFKALASGNLIPGLSRSDILDMKFHFPSDAEQQKIAACLLSIDELITAQSKKIDALKTHKCGLMQQLFPVMNEVEG